VNFLAYVPNPFGLAAPPAWFLADLTRFDPDLVIFPSQQEAVYRLGRKVKHAPDIWRSVKSLSSTTADDGTPLHARPDSKVMAQHGLVPVTSILPSGLTHWGPEILRDLAHRDIQRYGGGDAFVDALEANEDAEAARQNQAIAGDLAALSHQAYSDIAWKSGRRVAVRGSL
jgi:hypothetical protein